MDESPPQQDAFLNLIRAHELLLGEVNRFLKTHDLTIQQYNVIRILYVRAGEDGLPCLNIAERLLNRVPDITRLLDRMEKRGLVSRARSARDRRVVLTRLTDKGHKLATLHDDLTAFHIKQFAHMDLEDVQALDALLVKVLNRPTDSEQTP